MDYFLPPFFSVILVFAVMSNICNSRRFAFKNVIYCAELIAVAADKIPKWFPLIMLLLEIQGLRFYGKIREVVMSYEFSKIRKVVLLFCLVLIF